MLGSDYFYLSRRALLVNFLTWDPNNEALSTDDANNLSRVSFWNHGISRLGIVWYSTSASFTLRGLPCLLDKPAKRE